MMRWITLLMYDTLLYSITTHPVEIHCVMWCTDSMMMMKIKKINWIRKKM